MDYYVMARDITYILLSSLFFFIFGNWVLSVTSPDEGKNLDAALRMLETGDFIVPYYNCEYRFEKPPLFYWLTDIFFFLFGVNEFSARLVSGLSATGIAVLTYLIGKEFLGRDVATVGALIYTTLIHNWVEARAAVPEMLLTFFMTLGIYLFLKGRYVLGWVSLGFAFLAKGPVGVLLPVAVYLLWKRNFRFLNIKGIVLFSVIGFSWYAMMIYKFGFLYFYKFFLYENILRYTGHKSIHPYPFYYYVPIISVSALFFLPKIPVLIKRWDRTLNPLLFWFLFVLVFYSVAKNKLHHYVLFLYPPLAMMLAYYTGRKYVASVISASLLLVSGLLIYAYKIESDRFVPKVARIIAEKKPENLFFYKTENSAIVFYTRRCIERISNADKIPKGSIVITKKKHMHELSDVRVIFEGNELGKRFVLIEVH